MSRGETIDSCCSEDLDLVTVLEVRFHNFSFPDFLSSLFIPLNCVFNVVNSQKPTKHVWPKINCFQSKNSQFFFNKNICHCRRHPKYPGKGVHSLHCWEVGGGRRQIDVKLWEGRDSWTTRGQIFLVQQILNLSFSQTFSDIL